MPKASATGRDRNPCRSVTVRARVLADVGVCRRVVASGSDLPACFGERQDGNALCDVLRLCL
jgi:hypothetical protein